MQPKTLKTLEDIRDAAAFITQVTRGKTRDDYVRDRLLRQAVERNFEIIGEAIKRLDVNDTAAAARISNHARIIAFRNTLIHGYDLVDDPLVWETIPREVTPAPYRSGAAAGP